MRSAETFFYRRLFPVTWSVAIALFVSFGALRFTPVPFLRSVTVAAAVIGDGLILPVERPRHG